MGMCCCQGGTKQLKKATAPAKKAVATPIKKAVPKTSVGTKSVGKRKGSGGGECTKRLSTLFPWSPLFPAASLGPG